MRRWNPSRVWRAALAASYLAVAALPCAGPRVSLPAPHEASVAVAEAAGHPCPGHAQGADESHAQDAAHTGEPRAPIEPERWLAEPCPCGCGAAPPGAASGRTGPALLLAAHRPPGGGEPPRPVEPEARLATRVPSSPDPVPRPA